MTRSTTVVQVFVATFRAHVILSFAQMCLAPVGPRPVTGIQSKVQTVAGDTTVGYRPRSDQFLATNWSANCRLHSSSVAWKSSVNLAPSLFI